MTKSKYYTQERIDEFNLYQQIEINSPRQVSVNKWEDKWSVEYLDSNWLPTIESWYGDKDRFGDMDLSKRIRVKTIKQ